MQLPEQLKAIFSSLYPPSEAFLADLEGLAEPVFLPRKSEWVSEGSVCKKVLFLQKGLLYSSYEEDKYTVTTWFMKENDFVISVESFLQQTPSKETITALEDCEGLALSYTTLRQLAEKHHCFLFIYSRLIEHYYLLSEQRAFNLRKREATDRYRFLLSHHPEIIRRVPLTLIASYLGVNLETLSRIRAKI